MVDKGVYIAEAVPIGGDEGLETPLMAAAYPVSYNPLDGREDDGARAADRAEGWDLGPAPRAADGLRRANAVARQGATAEERACRDAQRHAVDRDRAAVAHLARPTNAAFDDGTGEVDCEMVRPAFGASGRDVAAEDDRTARKVRDALAAGNRPPTHAAAEDEAKDGYAVASDGGYQCAEYSCGEYKVSEYKSVYDK